MKDYHSKNRKKIRGWKRRIKQINAWGKHIKIPYLQYFNKAGDYTYERCFLYPFYVLEKRQPPLWFYKLMIAEFVTACSEWDKVFKALNVPYDLQIWIYDPSYMWSEIICRRVEKVGDRSCYAWEAAINKPFPFAKFSTANSGLENLEWILADEETIIWENELEEYNSTVEELLNEGYIKKDSGENGFYYAKKIGDLWVGRMKKSN